MNIEGRLVMLTCLAFVAPYLFQDDPAEKRYRYTTMGQFNSDVVLSNLDIFILSPQWIYLLSNVSEHTLCKLNLVPSIPYIEKVNLMPRILRITTLPFSASLVSVKCHQRILNTRVSIYGCNVSDILHITQCKAPVIISGIR